MAENGVTRIGKYEIQAELGQGGFGRVYRAFDPTVGRLVAIKVLTAASSDLLVRFRNEAAAAGNLHHKNIITIYEFGEHDGLPFLVMEYLEGEDLNQIIASHRPLTLLQKVNIMMQVADGLDCAHRNGVVHRDVKPANIRILADGTVKIMDFGIARLTRETAARLTRQGDVVGTLLYMSPEQIMGSEVDALCDIFAYGVIYYELLTGTHPFQARDPGAVLYKVTSQDPEPITNLVPECPEPLELVVRRTLQKDRELRYQSLKDVQWDTEPILLDLKRERAAGLVGEAGRLYEGGDLEHAQSFVSEILTLDPANRTARDLRQTIQTRLKKRQLQPRIEALTAKGNEALAERRFGAAIDNLEAALRLDSESLEVRQLLETARAQQEQVRAAARLLVEARKEFSSNNLATALEKASQSVTADPTNADARRFLEEVGKEIERREQQRRLERALEHAAACLSRDAFDDAASALTGLDAAQRNASEVVELLGRIETSRAAREREQRIRAELNAITGLLRASRLAEAVERSRALRDAFPTNKEISDILARSEADLAAQRRFEAVERLADEARGLADAGEFEQALRTLDEGSRTYPGENTLAAAQRQITTDWQARKRYEAVSALVTQCQELVERERPQEAVQLLKRAPAEYQGETRLRVALAGAQEALAQQVLRARQKAEEIERVSEEARRHASSGEYAQALEILGEGLHRYPDESSLAAARRRIGAEWEARKRSEAISALVKQSQALIEQSRPDDAVSLLAKAGVEYPGEPDLSAALARALQAVQAKQKAEDLERVTREAGQQAGAGKYARALEILDEGLRHYRNESSLVAARQRIGAEWEARKRSEAIGALVKQGEALIDNRRPDEAVSLLERAGAEFPGEADLGAVLARARQAVQAKQKAEDLERAAREAGKQAGAGKYARAIEILDEGLRRYPDESSLVAARQRIGAEWEAQKRSEAIGALLKQSRALIDKGRPDEAVSLLERAGADYPGEADLTAALARARQVLQAKQKADEVERLTREAGKHAGAGKYAQALATLDEGLGRYPGENSLVAARQRIGAEWEAQKRSEAINALLKQGEALIDKGRPDEAVSLLERAGADYPGEADLPAALARAQQVLRAKQKAEDVERVTKEARQHAAAGKYAQALEILDEGLRRYPDENSLVAARRRIGAEWEAQKRSEAIDALVKRGQALIGQGRPDAAVSLLARAGAEYPGDVELSAALARALEALRARQKAEIEATVAEARRSADSGEFDRALRALDDELRRYPGEETLAAARQQVSAEWEARQRAEALRAAEEVERTSQEARQHASAGSYERALEILDEGLRRYPDASSLTAVRQRIGAEWEARKRSDAIDTLVKQGQALIDQERPDDAVSLLERAAGDYRGEARVSAALARAQEALRARQRAEIEAAKAEARRHADSGEFEQALQVLDDALRRYPGDGSLTAARQRISEEWDLRRRADAVKALAEQAQALINQGQPQEAIRLLEGAVEYRGEPGLSAALARAQEALRARQKAEIEAAAAEARRHADSGEFKQALQVLDDALSRYPRDGSLTAARQRIGKEWEVRQRVDAVRALVEQAQALINQGQPQEAVRLLEGAAGYRDESEWSAALARAQEALGARQKAEIKAAAAESRRHAGSGEFKQALQVLDDALSRYPGNNSLAAARQRISAEWAVLQRADAVKALVEQAQTLINQGQPQEAVRLLEGAAEYRGESELGAVLARAQEALRARQKTEIEAALAEARRHADSGEFNRALQVLDDALRRYPGDGSLAAARQQIGKEWEVRRRADAVKALVEQAQTLINQGQPQEAVRLLEGAAEYRGESELSAALARAQEALRAARKAEVEVVAIEAMRHAEAGDPKRALRVLDKGLRKYPGEDSLVSLRQEVVANRKLAKTAAPGHASLVTRRTAMIAVAALSVVVLAIAGLWRTRPGGAVPAFTIRTTPEGATIRINDQVCVTPHCDLRLPPGKYEFEARLPGYAIQKGEITADKSESRAVDLILKPLPAVAKAPIAPPHASASSPPPESNLGTLIVEAGVDDATVFVNGKPWPQRTAGGQLSLPLEARRYVVRVDKTGYRAEPVQARAEIGKGRQVRLRFTMQPSEARLIVTGAARGAKVAVDGKPAGAVGEDGRFSIKAEPGERRIEFSKEGYQPKLIVRNLGPGATLTLGPGEVQLTPVPQPKPQQPPAVQIPPVPQPKPQQPSVTPEPPRPDPKMIEAQDWGRIKDSQNAGDFAEFLKKHPAGQYSSQASAKLEEIDWAGVNKTGKAALQAFLSRHGNGPHAQAARALIDGMDRQEADALAAAQRAKEQKELQAKRASMDEQAVMRTLAEFEAAYNGKNLKGLQTIWTGMSKNVASAMAGQFRDARSLTFQMRSAGQATVSGDSATVNCTRTLAFTTKDGQRFSKPNEPVRVTLDRAGTASGWVIHSITPY